MSNFVPEPVPTKHNFKSSNQPKKLAAKVMKAGVPSRSPKKEKDGLAKQVQFETSTLEFAQPQPEESLKRYSTKYDQFL